MDDLDHACLKILKLLRDGYSVGSYNIFIRGGYETTLVKCESVVVVRTQRSMPVTVLNPPPRLVEDCGSEAQRPPREVASMEDQLIRGLEKHLESWKHAHLPDCLL